MLIEHRAGVMDYPTPTSTTAIPDRQLFPKYKTNIENSEPNTHETEETETSPKEDVQEPVHNEEETPYDPKEDEAHITDLQKRNRELEERVQALTRIGQTLVAAITQSQQLLSSTLDDPELLESLRTIPTE